jgi:hypothetical protein
MRHGQGGADRRSADVAEQAGVEVMDWVQSAVEQADRSTVQLDSRRADAALGSSGASCGCVGWHHWLRCCTYVLQRHLETEHALCSCVRGLDCAMRQYLLPLQATL